MKPGLKAIISGAVLILIGVILLPVLILVVVLRGGPDGVQFKVPGSAQAVVEQPGRYYLWNETRTMYDGTTYNRPEYLPDGMEIRIRDGEGNPLKFVSDTTFTVEIGGSNKRSVGYVQIESPGTVFIEISGGREDRIVSFAQSRFLKIFGLVSAAVVLGVLIVCAGIAVGVWGIVRLRREPGGKAPPALTRA